jgi:PAS domain S-box-containing protein
MTRTSQPWKRLVFALHGGNCLNGIVEEHTARGFHLLLSCALIWILLLVAVVPFSAVRPRAAAIAGIVTAAATIGALRLVRARRIRSASLLFVTTFWCVAEGISALNGGLRSTLYCLVVLIIVNAGWLLGKSSAIGLAAASLLISFAEVVLEYSGHPLPRYFPGTPFLNWTIFAGILLFALNPILTILETLQKQVRDIREEKRLLQRLKLLAHTLDSVDECVSICDPDDRLLFVNRAFVRTYGYEESNLIGEHITIVRSPLNSSEFTAKILPDTLALGWRGELWNRKRDGTDFLVTLSTAAVRDGDGKVEATVGVARDITERKLAEAELMSTRDRAESANRAKSEFLAMMSHEIRTPLNGVIGMTGLLLDTGLSAEQREYAETARRSGEALLTVINDILDFSKIEAGRMVFESFGFDLRLVIEEVNEMLAPGIEGRNLDLVLEYPPDVPRHFIGDAGRIRQVVTNLAGNAVKFTPGGHVLINVSCESQDGEKALVRVAVEDTGPGIPAEKLDSLFEKFSQMDSSTTRKFGGTGLGLAISKQLVNLMGGQMGVTSQVGEGSTFWFTLALRLDAQPHAGPVPVADLLRGLRVLIVDDNEVTRRVLDEQIASWQMRNGSYAGAAQALNALHGARVAGDPYQIALLDCNMPDLDGARLAAAIKADPRLSDTVVIMFGWVCTNCGTCKKAMDARLAKPVRQSQLLNTLEKVWSKRLQSGSATRTKAPHEMAAVRSKLVDGFAGAPARVLVVEDNIVNQKVAARMLERLGLRPDVAANGCEAVELCAILPYDLIFMDCQMPEMDGYTATAEIRKWQGSNGRVAIIAMTADVMEGCREHCIAAGMDDYIAKPMRLDDMIAALKKWVPQTIPAAAKGL